MGHSNKVGKTLIGSMQSYWPEEKSGARAVMALRVRGDLWKREPEKESSKSF